MNSKEYANYDYQTTTIPFKSEYGVSIGKETKSSFKLCTKDCVYKDNWNKLKEWLEESINYEEYDKVERDTFKKVLEKLKEIEGGINE